MRKITIKLTFIIALLILISTAYFDFSKPFLWFDDDLFHNERQELLKHDVLENWIEVDLRKDPDMLGKFLQSFPIPINGIEE